MSKKVAILFSGGLDSTALAYQNCLEGNDVLLVYTKILNNPNKTKRELESCHKIKEILFDKFPNMQLTLAINEVKIGRNNENLNFAQIPVHFLSMVETCCNHWVDEIQIGYVMGDDAISYLDDLRKLYKDHRFLFEQEPPKLTFPLTKTKKIYINGKYRNDNVFKELLKHVTFCESELTDVTRCNRCHSCKRYDYEFDGVGIPQEFYHYYNAQELMEEHSSFVSAIETDIHIGDGCVDDCAEMIYDPRETE